jgi:V8-like Glu-specific endopeptidase
MGITVSNRIVALAVAPVLAVSAQALLPRSASAASVAAAAAVAPVAPVAPAVSAVSARGAWLTGNTVGRGLRLVHGGRAAAAVGKIFFTLGATDYVCSGALVRSKHVDVVLTAAHCVSDGHGAWATNWRFVPGYRDGAEPYGQYTARRFFVSPKWTGPDGESEQYDVAFVRVTPATLYGGSRVASPPAGLPVRFAKSQASAELPRTYVFGYPALPPFSGLYANYCAGASRVARTGSRRGSTATDCSMTAGDSGGPWFARFSPRGGGAIVAVTTFKLSGNMRTLYGTVLGQAARALYRAATRV